MSQNAVIFDWNGTVLDDAHCMVEATNVALAAFDVPPVDLQTYREVYTVPLRDAYISFGCTEEQFDQNHDEITSNFMDAYDSLSDSIKIRQGGEVLLLWLRDQRMTTAILSNYTIEKIKAQAERLNIVHLFDEIMAYSDDGNSPLYKSGKGDWLQRFIKKHDVKHGIVVGDSIEEIEIANDYGFTSIAIINGTCSRERLEKAKPDFLILKLEEIKTIAAKVFI